MAVKTEQELLAECASGKAVTASMLADVINTLFAQGGSSGAPTVFVGTSNSSENIHSLLTAAGIGLSDNTVIVVCNPTESDCTLTYSDQGVTPVQTVVIPAGKYVAIVYDSSSDTQRAPASLVS